MAKRSAKPDYAFQLDGNNRELEDQLNEINIIAQINCTINIIMNIILRALYMYNIIFTLYFMITKLVLHGVQPHTNFITCPPRRHCLDFLY